MLVPRAFCFGERSVARTDDLEINWEDIGDDNTIHGVKIELNPDSIILQLRSQIREIERYRDMGVPVPLRMLKSWGMI